MDFLFRVVAIVVGFAMMVGIAKLSLGPISRAAGILKAPTRFRLSDFVWLVLQIQIVLAVCAQAIDLNDIFGLGLALSLLLGATTAMWLGAVSCVSKAGVVDPWRRGVFVLCQLPLTFAFMFAIPFCLAWALGLPLPFMINQSQGIPLETGVQIVLFAVSIILGLASLGLHYVSFWVLQESSWAKTQVAELASKTADEQRTVDEFKSFSRTQATSTGTAVE